MVALTVQKLTLPIQGSKEGRGFTQPEVVSAADGGVNPFFWRKQ